MSFLRIAALAATSITQNPYPEKPLVRHDAGTQLLPKGFLLGAASAAHQIEGNNNNDWTDWENTRFPDGRPHVARGEKAGIACDSWNRFEQDLAALEALGANAYRFSIEWSRIEPEEGRFDESVLAKYRSWIEALRSKGITPMVTLQHFTLPRWISQDGGWENDRTIDRSARYAEHVARSLGSVVDLWCTINEPNVLSVLGYVDGVWPPGKRDARLGVEVLVRQMKAHAKMASALRTHDRSDADGDGRPTLIGIAHHVRVLEAKTRSPADRVIAGFSDHFFNQCIVSAVESGRMQAELPGITSVDVPIKDLRGSFDYLGLNYYSRDLLALDLKDPSLSKRSIPDGAAVNDLGWEIYPEGLYKMLVRFSHTGLPLYVTENGIADRSGTRRSSYLQEHFRALERAASEGVDVRGYFHWSLLDNFEWAEGFEPCFGLFHTDYNDPERKRTSTPAVETFRSIAERHKLLPNKTP